MNTETCLLTHFILNDYVESTCNFIPKDITQGTVIYEVIRVIDSIPIFLSEHVTRFFNSISLSGNRVKFTDVEISNRIITLISLNRMSIGNIRFQVSFAHNDKTTFSAWITPYSYPTQSQYSEGVKVISANKQRKNPNLKIRNQELKDDISEIIKNNKIYEVLLLNENGLITEGSRSNIFFIRNNEILTPKIKNILPGITRQKIMELSSEHRKPIKETDIYMDELNSFAGAFLSGTSPGILPVSNIDGVAFDPANHEIMQLSKLYNNLIDKYTKSFNQH